MACDRAEGIACGGVHASRTERIGAIRHFPRVRGSWTRARCRIDACAQRAREARRRGPCTTSSPSAKSGSPLSSVAPSITPSGSRPSRPTGGSARPPSSGCTTTPTAPPSRARHTALLARRRTPSEPALRKTPKRQFSTPSGRGIRLPQTGSITPPIAGSFTAARDSGDDTCSRHGSGTWSEPDFPARD